MDFETELAELDDFSELASFQSSEITTLLDFHGQDDQVEHRPKTDDIEEQKHQETHDLIEFLYPKEAQGDLQEDENSSAWTWQCV